MHKTSNGIPLVTIKRWKHFLKEIWDKQGDYLVSYGTGEETHKEDMWSKGSLESPWMWFTGGKPKEVPPGTLIHMPQNEPWFDKCYFTFKNSTFCSHFTKWSEFHKRKPPNKSTFKKSLQVSCWYTEVGLRKVLEPGTHRCTEKSTWLDFVRDTSDRGQSRDECNKTTYVGVLEKAISRKWNMAHRCCVWHVGKLEQNIRHLERHASSIYLCI